jgi:hypothetical protein
MFSDTPTSAIPIQLALAATTLHDFPLSSVGGHLQ